MDNAELKEIVAAFFEPGEAEFEEFAGELTLRLPREKVVTACEFLRDQEALAFNYLTDLTALDYLNYTVADDRPRFAVVYHLYSIAHGHRLRLKCGVPEDDARIETVSGVWPGAVNAEREAYDMFGIEFDNHPNLTRILMPEDWEGHPLRKDFPLGGGKSFYFKRDTQQYAGEPEELVPRIRIQDGDV